MLWVDIVARVGCNGIDAIRRALCEYVVSAPVSHQKQPGQNKTKAIESEQECSKINEADRYSTAHNGLVAG
jgi:hypothetical protein